MNINQMARNQQMMLRFIDRSAGSPYAAQFTSQSGLQTTGSGLAGVLQSMGGMQGGTVRQMAQRQMSLYNAQQAQSAQDTQNAALLQQTSAASALPQQPSIREQYTPISDEATEAMQQLALSDAKASVGGTAFDSAARDRVIGEQLKSVAPSKRTAAYNTMNKVWQSEMDRIGGFLRENADGWESWGDKFDSAVLDNYKPGVNIWI